MISSKTAKAKKIPNPWKNIALDIVSRNVVQNYIVHRISHPVRREYVRRKIGHQTQQQEEIKPIAEL